jgi:hypothetical protein
MSAVLKIYSDAGCTQEITTTYQLGPTSGLAGTPGEIYTTSVYLKNTGDKTASSIVLTETSDTDARGSYSLDDNTYENTSLTVGDLTAGSSQRIYIKISVAALTAIHVDEPLNFSCAGTTL